MGGTENETGLRVSNPDDSFDQEANATQTLATPGARRATTAVALNPSVQNRATTIQRYFDPNVTQGNASQARKYLEKEFEKVIKNYVMTQRKIQKNENLPAQEIMSELMDGRKEHMKTMGELSRSKSADKFNLDDLSVLVMYLNRMEESSQTLNTASDTASDTAGGSAGSSTSGKGKGKAKDTSQLNNVIKFGTEFTFTDDILQGKKAFHGKPVPLKIIGNNESRGVKDEQGPVREHAFSLIRDWIKKVSQDTIKGVRLNIKYIQDDTVKARGQAAKFTYSDPNNNDENVLWYWVLDIDSSCLETQTMPSTLHEIAENNLISQVIDGHIFEVANSLGLGVDIEPTGGGHISVDMATAFGGSVQLFIETLRELQDDTDSWFKNIHRDNVETYDQVNAPWLKDLQIKEARESARSSFMKASDDIVKRAREGWLDIAGAATCLIEFNEQLYNESAADRKDVLAEMSHYQAVNIEHAAEGEGRARLELRDIPAQTDRVRLIEDLKVILEIIQNTRTRVRGM